MSLPLIDINSVLYIKKIQQMVFREKMKDNWENDLWQSVDEKDVMMLRKQLKQIQISLNENLRNYGMNTM